MKRFIPLAAVLVLSACASPETRVRTGLMNAGLSEPLASCMATRLVDRLSMAQLRRLGSISTLRNGRIGDLTVSELLHKIRALDDPEIVSVVTSAGFRCALSS